MRSSKIEEQKNNLLNYIDSNVLDGSIKVELINAFKDIFDSQIKNIKYSRDRLKIIIAWYILSYQLMDMKITDMNWRTICALYNTNYYSKLCEVEKLFTQVSEKTAAKAMRERIEIRKSFDGYYDYKNAIIKLYLRLSENKSLFNLKNIQEIYNYKIFLVNEYSIKFDDVNEEYDFYKLHKKILNNMPIDSDYNCFIQEEYTLTKNNTINKINFNCMTTNKFIKGLIINFIDQIYKQDNAPHNRGLKVFIYYLGKSFNQLNVTDYSNINYDVLKKQYEFFYSWGCRDNNEFNSTALTLLLVEFYRFILNRYQDISFNEIEKKALNNKNIHRILRENYQLLFFNPYENIPEENKFCIIQNEYTMHNAAQANNNFFVDLTDLDKETQRDLKQYIWYSSNKIQHRFDSIRIILKFLSFKNQYYKFFYNGKKKEDECRYEIDENVLYMYMDKISEEYDKKNTIKYIVSQIRYFLIFHKNKFRIKDKHLDIISLKGLADYDGGSPISESDLKVIYNEVKKEEKNNSNMRIYTIVFELCLLTNLRIGEILSLERNCIIENNKVRYLSKVSEKNYKIQEFAPEIISLINEARLLTNNIKDDYFMEKYIFLEKSITNFSERVKKIEFYLYFKKIIEKCSEKLTKKHYSPYNLRHTFIDNVYREGVKNDLSLSKMAIIAGNSFDTAKKYYRSTNDYEIYVETLAKVKLTDIEVMGKVFSKEPEKSKPVNKNLGCCNESKCTFEIAECLMCKHFFTFTNRIEVFEKRIEDINKRLEECNDRIEKEDLVCEKRSLSKYLLELLKVKEGEENEA